jgi:hypothetical protein
MGYHGLGGAHVTQLGDMRLAADGSVESGLVHGATSRTLTGAMHCA